MSHISAFTQQIQTVLVTGAHGGLAKSIYARLPKNIIVIGLVRPGSIKEPDHACLVFDQLDILSANIARIDAVIHLAARIPSACQQVPELLSVNVDLVSRLVQLFPRARHVLASSVSVYDPVASGPFHINSLTKPETAYGWSKLAAECVVRQCTNHAIIRFSSLIGANGRRGTFVPQISAAALRGCITIYGDGSRLQNYVDLDDAADMCLRALFDNRSFTTLGVADRSYSNNQIAEMLSTLTGASIRYVGTDESPSFVYDRTSAVELGPCRVPLLTTLKKILAS